MKLFTQRFPVEYVDGSIVEVRSLSIVEMEEFRTLFELFAEELKDPKYKNLDINKGYVQEPLCKYYIDSMLSIVKLDPSKIAGDHLFKLLFPHNNEDGSHCRQGLLIKFIFGEVEGGAQVPKEKVDAFASALGKLWASMDNFNQCMDVLKTLNYDDLGEVIKHRMEALMPPEEKAKKIAMEKSLKARDDLREKLGKGQKLVVGKQIDISELV